MTLARGEREWALLVSEYNICKKKLESKRQALKILMGDLESCQRERDIYKTKIKQMQQEIENYKKKELENEHSKSEVKARRSPSSPSIRSPEHNKIKRERKFSGQTIWEQELQSVRDRKNKTLSQLLCEAREENKALKNDFMDLRVLYREAQEDIILMRENIARQITNEQGSSKVVDLEVRQDLIQRLEKNQEKVDELEREVQAVNDEKSEIINERDHYRDKSERLNTQLNFILGADEQRIVDIDAVLTENRYQKEQIKQLKEDVRIANASLARQKAAIEKKKARLVKAGYYTAPGQSFQGSTAVKQSLPSLLSEISSTFGHHGVASSTISDLQCLANSLSESLSEKDIALLHQRNTNKILGNRVTELEKKLKTLEVAGLWSLDGHHGYGSDDMLKFYLEKLKKSPRSSQDDSTDTNPTPDQPHETEGTEFSPDLHNGDSVFFGGDAHDIEHDLDGVISPTISEEEDDEEPCRNNNDGSERGAASCGVYSCSAEHCEVKGDSSMKGDSSAKGDSLTMIDLSSDKSDSTMIDDTLNKTSTHVRGDSPVNGDSQTKGDSLAKDNSSTVGHSHTDSHSTNMTALTPNQDNHSTEELNEVYIVQRHSPSHEHCGNSISSDNTSHGVVHINGNDLNSIKDTFSPRNSDTPVENLTEHFQPTSITTASNFSISDSSDISTTSQIKTNLLTKSSEHSPLNRQEKCLDSQYGSLGNQSHHFNFDNDDNDDDDDDDTADCYDQEEEQSVDTAVCCEVLVMEQEDEESVSDYFEPDSSSLDDLQEQAK